MSERACIRRCTERGVHYATCVNNSDVELLKRAAAEDAGLPYTSPCAGCAPRECRDGSLICDRCFGRMRALLADGPDLLGRVRSLADPMKATPTDKAPGGRSSSVEAPAPVDADLLDAIAALEQLEPWWFVHLADFSNDLDTITWLGEVVLDVHPEVEGERSAWSVADAMAKWGAERRTDTFVYPEGDDVEEIELGPVREWFDRLLTIQQAAHRADVSQRQVQRWVKSELIEVVARHRGARGSVIKYVRTSAVDAVVKEMRDNQERTRFAAAAQTTEHGRSHDA